MHTPHTDVIVVGGGPCGLSAAIHLQEAGFSTVVIEKGNIVQAIYRYPTHQTFFSTADKLEIGGIPFIIDGHKPKRNQALAYYREVARQKNIAVHSYETVTNCTQETDGTFHVYSERRDGEKKQYHAQYVVIATGYYDSPNMMDVPGEELSNVFHYFKEAHPYVNQDVVVIGGKNSAVDATLELERAGARVTVLYRGKEFSKSVKPWILPEFQSLIHHGKINMVWDAEVIRIEQNTVTYRTGNEEKTMANDFVFAMTGYHPDHSFLTRMGVKIESDTGRPVHNKQTMETNVENLFIAGVIAAGNEANEIFIENGRFHGEHITAELVRRKKNDSANR